MKATFLVLLAQICACIALNVGSASVLSQLKPRQRTSTALDMAVYSSDKGVLAQITEERDACGVGFVASMSKKASHSIIKQVNSL